MKQADAFPLMSWHARPDMSCEYVSPAWLDFTGTTPEYAQNGGWARTIHPEDLPRWLDACVRAFDERRAFEIDYRLRRRDGAYRWVRDRAVPRYSQEGAFIGFSGHVSCTADLESTTGGLR
jgi:PAS domain S-box-containing protein